jgi:VanZ family protein
MKNNNKVKLFKILLVMLWVIIIFLFSSQVATESSELSGKIVNSIAPVAPEIIKSSLTFLVRKSAHIFLYFVLGILTANLLVSYKLKAKLVYIYSLIFVFAYAITDEIHQLFVAGRSGEVRDVLLDTIAGAVGIALYLGIRKLHSTKRASKSTKNIVE